jgi:3-hydroxyacyl-[acyl-carrier-protein] dehydratase
MENTPTIETLETQFRKCSPETIRTIYDFKRTREIELVPPIVRGLAQKYLQAEAVEKLSDSQTTLASLGVDSLTMMEIMLDVQDALDLTITDEELQGVQTLDEVSALLRTKLHT